MSFSRLRASLSTAAPAYLALTCFGLAATPAAAQDNGNEAKTRLGGVTVTDTAIDEDGIKIEKSASPKYTQPLLDTPQTIQVIGKELFNEQGATTLTEALRNSPGVGTFYAGENGSTSTGDAVYMRGFDTSNSIFVDGVRDLGSISRDVFNTEQVEVLKGPAGTDNGRTAPTGAINMVSKQANLESALSGTLSVGVDGQKRATADINQAIDAIPNSAFRLNALWQNSDVPGRDHVNNKRIGLASSFGVGLGTDSRAYLNLLYVKQDNIPDGFVPTVGLPGWSPQLRLENLVDRPVASTNYYGKNGNYDNVEAYMVTLRLEHDFSDTLKITNTARWGRTAQDYLLLSFMTTGGTTANPTAGNIQYSDKNDLSTYTLNRTSVTTRDSINEILTDQLNLRADFSTAGIEHNLSAGIEITSETQTLFGITATASSPLITSLYNPNWNDGGALTVARSGANTRGRTDTQSLYLFDTVKFLDDALLVTGGIRFDRYQTGYSTNTTYIHAKDTLFNWKIGAVYKPVKSLSLYVNYAISQQPPGGANFTLSTASNNANNPNLKPQEAKTIEAGVKWSVLDDKLFLNAAIYRTDVSNEINSTTLDNIQSGEKQVKGIELSAVGRITDNWSISAGYSYLDSKVQVGSNVAADGSPNLTYIPGDSFTSWTNYRFPFGLEVGGGVRYNAGLRRGTDGAVGTPAYTNSYTVADALLAYSLTDNIKLRVNAYNIFDKKYVQAVNKSGYRYTPGQPQTFLFSADFRF